MLVVVVGVGELHFGDSVFVEEGDGGAFVDGLLEGESAAHVGGEIGVLGAVGFVGQVDDVGALGEDGVKMAGFGPSIASERDVLRRAHWLLTRLIHSS